MMKFLLIPLIFCFSSLVLACPALIGSWQSSKEWSMEYNNQFSELTSKQSDLLDQILGYTKITYTETEKKHHALPPVTVTLNGTEHDFEFLEFVYPYKPISCDDELVVIEHKDDEVGDIKLVLNFDGPNAYWLSPEMLPKSREYFIRVSN